MTSLDYKPKHHRHADLQARRLDNYRNPPPWAKIRPAGITAGGWIVHRSDGRGGAMGVSDQAGGEVNKHPGGKMGSRKKLQTTGMGALLALPVQACLRPVRPQAGEMGHGSRRTESG